MTESVSDLIVIGGGPGGYVAAIRAAQLGLSVTLVERSHLGGICLNWGCIPTKALLRSAELYRLMGEANSFGLSAGSLGFDLDQIVARSRAVAGRLQAGVRHLLKKNKVTVIEGTARLIGPGQVAVEGQGSLTAPHIILATGARARLLLGFEPDGRFLWSYREALTPDILPRRLVVIGSGAIGIEFASFFAAFGSEVTVIEALDRILPVEDHEISALARTAFERQGLHILTGATVTGLTKHEHDVEITVESGGQTLRLPADRVIVAIGITGNVENIGLETTQVRVEKGHIATDSLCRTDQPGLYAIGDVAGPPWLAHKASHEGVLCVEAIAGLPGLHPIDPKRIPGCTYGHPQVASVGLTEAAAIAQGYTIRVGRFPFAANGKAIALGEVDGLVKTLFDSTSGELLGAHIIGPEATEMIQGYAIATTLEATEADLIATTFPHPTLSEAMHEAVLAAFGRALHI
ncbi:dihydrolipoyl dehydrogenase [Magnetospirillum molischianum]|uniref:Dihydrolipoyl dehydrogenase n=1 Tax=Magnetospirillum molischianum DSM 120 TaxID=1150626 RepID=H8FPG8_MAGML|nr:dihydrolipoyl dehydrogenase [Magnetospirillum molischianum]CCG40256.1 Dihydrolipoyl dehydrogenase (E3 component of pyruvate and 2-oxoglutarate dehydrogenases complexes) (Dihydrolipoamide dehydrogenase) [Magnetospirillum molischianum DSM 120]